MTSACGIAILLDDIKVWLAATAVGARRRPAPVLVPVSARAVNAAELVRVDFRFFT
jgi:hypothetical protein